MAHARQLPKEKLIELFMSVLRDEPQEAKIPVSIFNKDLSSLEAIVKYLRDLGWSNRKVALTLKRSPQNTWITYKHATKKHAEKLTVKASEHDLPLSIFENTRLSVLETIATHLKKTLDYSEIAELLHRDKKTIITVVNRAKKKV